MYLVYVAIQDKFTAIVLDERNPFVGVIDTRACTIKVISFSTPIFKSVPTKT